MPLTEVILKENIRDLGAEADLVKVKSGYARNFLLPQGKAFAVTPANLRKLNHLKSLRAEREARELNEAESLSKKINKLKLQLILETGSTGKAFGSITARDLVEKIKAELPGVEIDHHQFQLDGPIKTTGEHVIPVKIHPDVQTRLTLIVKASKEPEPAPVDTDDDEAPAPRSRSRK